MIDNVLNILKLSLNEYIDARSTAGNATVVFPDASLVGDTREFEQNKITLQIINLEEENAVRPPDLYRSQTINGTKYQVNPEIRLNLFVLFVARFNNYEQSMKYLSLVIRYFQSHRIFDRPAYPNLHPEIDRLWVELVTMPFIQQNEIWTSLRSPYLPSFLYKVKMLVFRDEDALQMNTNPNSIQIALNTN